MFSYILIFLLLCPLAQCTAAFIYDFLLSRRVEKAVGLLQGPTNRMRTSDRHVKESLHRHRHARQYAHARHELIVDTRPAAYRIDALEAVDGYQTPASWMFFKKENKYRRSK